jgi:CRP-like cAMP-binding protein
MPTRAKELPSMPHSRPDVFAALRSVRLWRDADDDAVSALAAAARVDRVARGALLASEGDPPDRFAVVVSGKVRIYHLAADGRALTFETAGTGDPVAALAVLAGARYPANVEAATDAAVAWLPRQALLDLIDSQPAIARAIIADLATRVVNFTSVAAGLSLDVPSRLAGYLFQRALAGGRTTATGLVVELGMSKSELASALGTVPETLSRAFARLRDEGVLEVRSRDVVVKDVGALARLGAGQRD